MNVLRVLRPWWLGCLVVFLHGCGGGGGGGGSHALIVTRQPVSVTVEAGGTARFTSAASIPGAAVQWSRWGEPIPGANSPEYVLNDVSMADSGAAFQATFTSGGQTATSSLAGVIVTPRFVVTGVGNTRVDQGTAATFAVDASGRDPVFQWQRSNDDGVTWADIAGATQSTYTTAPAGLADHASRFRVVVGTGGAQVASDAGYLQVRPRLSLLAGRLGGCGYADGSGDGVRLCNVTGMATVGTTTFVFESGTISRVRRIAADGAVSTFVKSADSIPSAGAMAADGAGNLYIASSYTSMVRKVRPDGTVVDLAGSSGQQGLVDGAGAAARFAVPEGLAIDGAGNLYVSDTGNNTIRKITPAGVVTTIAGAPGSPTDGLLSFPQGLAVAPNGDLIVADTGNHVVRRITQAGVATLVAGAVGVSDFVNASGGAARFARPRDVAVDAAGVIYVADSNNHAIRRIATNGAVSTLAGGAAGADDGSGGAAQFYYPAKLTLDGSGNLMVADAIGNTVRRVTTAGAVATVAGIAATYDRTDGTGAAARLGRPGPGGVAADGTLYFVDGVQIRSVDEHGVVTTVAGDQYGGAQDGSGTSAQFEYPRDIAVAANGDVFVADMANCAIRRVSGGFVTTFAGQLDVCGFVDGTGNGAAFDSTLSLALAPNGDLLVVDGVALRRITPAGVVTTIAGQSGNGDGSSNDGPLASARFGAPDRIGVAGNEIFVSDWQLRRIADGVVSSPYIYADEGYLGSIWAMTSHAGKLYVGTGEGQIGTLSFGGSGPGNGTFVSMFPNTGELTVRLGAGSQLNRVTGLAFTPGGRLLVLTEQAILISD